MADDLDPRPDSHAPAPTPWADTAPVPVVPAPVVPTSSPAPPVDPAPAAVRPATFTTAAGGLENTRGTPWQDRWATGQNASGCWLIVADGISGGTGGAYAAEAAAAVAAAALAGTDLSESAILGAILLAERAVRPWYADGREGGTTLSIATITAAHVIAAAIGDSPILVATNGAPLRQVTPISPPGPLRAWLGSGYTTDPWLGSWPTATSTTVAVASDGINADALPTTSLTDLVTTALTTRRVGADDSTIVAAHAYVPPPPAQDTTW